MHLTLGTALFSPPPPDPIRPQNQLPLGLAPTGDFAHVRERARKDALDKWDALTLRGDIRLHQGRLWFPEAAQSDFATGFLKPTHWATSQFCQRLGMPTGYFRRCPNFLQDLQFNHWIQASEHGAEDKHDPPEPACQVPCPDQGSPDSDQPNWLLRCKGDVLRGVLSEKYAPLDNDLLLESLAPLLPKAFTVDWFSLTDESFHLRVVDPRKSRQILRGDDLMVGCHIGNSEVGKRAVTVDALIYRLVCQNGLIRLVKGKNLLYRRHVHFSAPCFKEALQRAILGALDAATAFLDQLEAASRTPVPDVPGVLELLARQENLSKSFLERVETSLKAEPASQQETLWGLANGLTQASQALPADDRYDMELLAGRLIEHGPPKLPARPVSAPFGSRRTPLAGPSLADEPAEGTNEDKNALTEPENIEPGSDDPKRTESEEKSDATNGDAEVENLRTKSPSIEDRLIGRRFNGSQLGSDPLNADPAARPVLGRA